MNHLKKGTAGIVLVCELYKSIQGEGRLTGVESVFVRTAGCNLRCWFCDTPYSSWQPEGQKQSIAEIVSAVQSFACRHVVITGGEPMLQRELIELTGRLREIELHITIETAGTIFLPVQCDLMSISPKLTNSAPSFKRGGQWAVRLEQTRHQPDVILRLIKNFDYQFKFVIDQEDDCGEVLDYLTEFPDISRECVLLMPQGTTVEELARRGSWIVPWCEKHGLAFCPRKQIEWFGHQRGT